MFKLSILIATLVSFAGISHAKVESQGEALYEAASCPKISSDYEKALAELKTISTTILAEAGCENAAAAALRLEQLVRADHQKIYEKALKKEGKMLSAKEAEALESYASQVSESVANIFNLMGASDCPVSKEKKSVIFRSLLSLSFDAIEGVSQVLGPYGAPISIGINVLKGVITGLSNFKEKNSGYKFKVSSQGREQAVLYTKSLCVFHNFKKEADVLLNASDRAASYVNLLQHLEKKVANLLVPGFCDGCQSLVDEFEMMENSEENKISDGKTLELMAEDINNKNGFNLGGHLLDALETKKWVLGQMNQLEIEELSFNESIGPALLGAELESLENFLVYNEAVDFMDWIYLEAKSSYQNYTKDASRWVNGAFRDLRLAERASQTGKKKRRWGVKRGSDTDIPLPTLSTRAKSDFVSLYDFKQYLLSQNDKLPMQSRYRDKFLIDSLYNKSMSTLKGVNRYMSSHNEYCNFFKSAGFYGAIYNSCNSIKMSTLNDVFIQESSDDPVMSRWLQDVLAENSTVTEVPQQEEWANHLQELFSKWQRVQERQMLNIMAN